MRAPTDDKLSANATYTRRWRERERAGKVLLKLEVDLAEITIGLIDRKLLDPCRADDPAALNAAAAKALTIFCEGSHHETAIHDKVKLAFCLAVLRRKTRGSPRSRRKARR
jgi:hypothetical protein